MGLVDRSRVARAARLNSRERRRICRCGPTACTPSLRGRSASAAFRKSGALCISADAIRTASARQPRCSPRFGAGQRCSSWAAANLERAVTTPLQAWHASGLANTGRFIICGIFVPAIASIFRIFSLAVG